ncbi:MAG: DUF456 domain-containing protein [Bacteroidales bacterium]|nr:DUF456 domain-containing protein [Bacteroidales bacterium]
MIDIFLAILALILVVVGIIGCFLPVIPGPPISFGGVLLAFFVSGSEMHLTTLIILGVLMVVVTVLDFLVPSFVTKKFGGSKWAERGSLLAMILCLLTVQWWAFLILPFVGAFVGEYLFLKRQGQSYSENSGKIWKAALGSFLGMLCGTMLKLCYSCFVIFFVVKDLIMSFFG